MEPPAADRGGRDYREPRSRLEQFRAVATALGVKVASESHASEDDGRPQPANATGDRKIGQPSDRYRSPIGQGARLLHLQKMAGFCGFGRGCGARWPSVTGGGGGRSDEYFSCLTRRRSWVSGDRRDKGFDSARARWHHPSQVQQRKGGDPMSHFKVARPAGPTNEILVTSVRIG
jgi:hypothetical protein